MTFVGERCKDCGVAEIQQNTCSLVVVPLLYHGEVHSTLVTNGQIGRKQSAALCIIFHTLVLLYMLSSRCCSCGLELKTRLHTHRHSTTKTATKRPSQQRPTRPLQHTHYVLLLGCRTSTTALMHWCDHIDGSQQVSVVVYIHLTATCTA